MSPPPCNGTPFFCRCLLGAVLSKILTKIKVLDGTVLCRPIPAPGDDHDLNFRSRSTSISRPDRSQFQANRTRNLGARHGGKARPLQGQGTGVVGGKARTSFQKICPEMILKKNSEILRPSLRPDRPQFYIQIDLNFTSRSTSMLRPDRSQFYVQVDLNLTSRSTSILRPGRPQFYIQIDLNFTFTSTSI